jgi:hypothetical protein
MIKSTQMLGFQAYMTTLVAGTDSVVISVVENFIVDAVGADVVERNSTIEACITAFIDTIRNSVIKYPNTKFGIVLPLGRPAILWYRERIDNITKFTTNGVKTLIADKDVNNVAIIDCISSTALEFEEDMVHLTKASAKIFLDVVLGEAERFFKS